MAIFNDPSSPVGKTIPLMRKDIERLRSGGDDRVVAEKAYNLDPDFRALTDYVLEQNKTRPMPAGQIERLPSLLLNKHYYGQWELNPSDDLTAEIARTSNEPGVFSRLFDSLQAPVEAATGLALKGLSKVGLEKAGQAKEVQELPENLSQTADVARVGIPIVAGLATGGASIPVSAAISGGVGAGSSLLASGLEKAAGEDQTFGGALKEAGTTGVVDAGLDAATMGLFRVAKLLPKAKGALELADDLDKGVGKVIQSTGDDIEKGRKAIQSLDLDLNKVKTYEDLTGAIDAKLSALKAGQDEVLDAVADARPLESFAKTAGKGKNAITTNPVTTALDHLEELYSKSGATDDLVRIKDLKELATAEGITARQINDIAREYGRGFKSFSSKTGEPLTSVNSQLYENTRKALKEASRSVLPNDAAKAIDEEMSNLIRTRDLTSEMAEKVQNLGNKVEMQSAGAKVGSFIGKILDAGSFGTLGGLLRGLQPSNVGLKTLNSISIQDNLVKNIDKIQKLTEQIDTLPEGEVVGQLKEIFGEAAARSLSSIFKGARGAVTNVIND